MNKLFLSLAFSCGAVQSGAKIVDVGVCPTAGISFLAKHLGFDYGVVISASHNPAKYNGIKIFEKTGNKIDEKTILKIEKKLLNLKINKNNNFGKFFSIENLVSKLLASTFLK